jgi:MerR family copper efflux transcriptional regulator
MRISEVAARTGLSIHAIRFYERLGLIDGKSVTRTENNYRSYTDDVFDAIRLIQWARQAGFALSELGALVKGGDVGKISKDGKIKLLESKLKAIDVKINEIKKARGVIIDKLRRLKKK